MKYRNLLLYGAIGGMIGVFLLHPLNMVIYRLEFQSSDPFPQGFWQFVFKSLVLLFTEPMLPMTVAFAVTGSAIGFLFLYVHSKLSESKRSLHNLSIELSKDIPALIAEGENARLEFKSTLRWDLKEQKVNKELEQVVLKTIAGFMNSEGGNLIIGVDDNGNPIGLDLDYKTLKRKDGDGFLQHLFGLIKTNLGGDLCSLVHVLFFKIASYDLVRIVIEPSYGPTYLNKGGESTFYIRMGNSTRNLGIQEGVAYIASHWKKL